MPAFKNHTGFPGVPNVAMFAAQFERFAEVIPIFEETNLTITGVTRDSTGGAKANCSVYLFRSDGRPSLQVPADIRGAASPTDYTARNWVWTGISDGSGNFSAGPLSRMAGQFFAVAWSSDGATAGVTLNTLTPA